ncbi:MAG TPA: helix-turn-helix domain-containing protein [Gemmatimonadaceae bacterium]|nr:helix-turn-helix domain-containing protein [Gemmatimonadaceae bacterium]
MSSNISPAPRAAQTAASSEPLTQVTTVLTPAERLRVDAAGHGLYQSLHRDSVDDVMRDVREARADAVVVSVSYCERSSSDAVASMVREFPRVPTLVLLSDIGPRTPQTLLSLGTSGVRRLIDVRDAAGWRILRSALTDECGNTVQRHALRQLAEDLQGATPDCWEFFRALFLSPPGICTVRRLAHQLNVVPSTLMSRFFRAGLPAPKRFLAMARLVRAAHLFENHGFSVANVANHLEYSSPQSFGRHVRTLLHVTAVEFRQRYDGAGMFERFRHELVLPNAAVLRRLSPLAHPTRQPARRYLVT